MGRHELVPGVYERLVDRGLRAALDGLADAAADERDLLAAEAPERLAAQWNVGLAQAHCADGGR